VRNKIIGILNILLGVLILFQTASFTFNVIPKLSPLYGQISYAPPITNYFLSFLMSVLGISNLYLGYKLFTPSKAKYFKLCLIILLITLLFLGYYSSIMLKATVGPLYNLSY